MRFLILLSIFFYVLPISAQVRPDQQPQKTPASTDAIYTQEDPAGTIRKILFEDARNYFVAKNWTGCIATTPSASDINSIYKGFFVTVCSDSKVYYVDGNGVRSDVLYDPNAVGTGGAVISDATLSGDGTNTTPLSIAQQGAANGDVLKWDGSSWTPAAETGGSGILKIEQSTIYDSMQVVRATDTLYFPDNHNIHDPSNAVLSLISDAASDNAFLSGMEIWKDNFLAGGLGYRNITDPHLRLYNNMPTGGIEFAPGGNLHGFADAAGRLHWYTMPDLSSDGTALALVRRPSDGRIGTSTTAGGGGGSSIWYEQGTTNIPASEATNVARAGSIIAGDNTASELGTNTQITAISNTSAITNPTMHLKSVNGPQAHFLFENRDESGSLRLANNAFAFLDASGNVKQLFDLSSTDDLTMWIIDGKWQSQSAYYLTPDSNVPNISGFATMYPVGTKSELRHVPFTEIPVKELSYDGMNEYVSHQAADTDTNLALGAPYSLTCPNQDGDACTGVYFKK